MIKYNIENPIEITANLLIEVIKLKIENKTLYTLLLDTDTIDQERYERVYDEIMVKEKENYINEMLTKKETGNEAT